MLLWSLSSGEVRVRIGPHDGGVRCVAIAPGAARGPGAAGAGGRLAEAPRGDAGGERVATGGADGIVRVWRAASGALERALRGAPARARPREQGAGLGSLVLVCQPGVGSRTTPASRATDAQAPRQGTARQCTASPSRRAARRAGGTASRRARRTERCRALPPAVRLAVKQLAPSEAGLFSSPGRRTRRVRSSHGAWGACAPRPGRVRVRAHPAAARLD